MKRPNDQLYRSSSITHANIPDNYLKKKRDSVFHKAFDNQSQIEDFKPPKYDKSEEDRKFLIEQFKKSFLTHTLSQEQHEILADAMKSQKFEKGNTIIKYGDMGSEYYLLNKGKVEVTVYQQGADPQDPKLEEQLV